MPTPTSLIRGVSCTEDQYMTPGYYKRPDVNAEMFDADGFYKTGDSCFTGRMSCATSIGA